MPPQISQSRCCCLKVNRRSPAFSERIARSLTRDGYLCVNQLHWLVIEANVWCFDTERLASPRQLG